MLLIRVFVGLASCRGEVNLARLVVHMNNPAHQPWPFRYLMLELTALRVVKVKLVPAVAFGCPQQLLVVVEKALERRPGIDEVIRRFGNHSANLAGSGIGFANVNLPPAAIRGVEAKVAIVF